MRIGCTARSGSSYLGSYLADRFEMLVAGRAVMEDLREYAGASIAPLFGPEVADTVEAIRLKRMAGIVRELDALRLQYPAYAEAALRDPAGPFGVADGGSGM